MLWIPPVFVHDIKHELGCLEYSSGRLIFQEFGQSQDIGRFLRHISVRECSEEQYEDELDSIFFPDFAGHFKFGDVVSCERGRQFFFYK